MRIPIFVLFTATFLTSGAVAADENIQESMPIELSAAQMDQITGGSGFENIGKVAWFSGTQSPVIGDGALFEQFGGGGTSLTGGGKSGSVFVPNNQGHSAL